MGIILGQRIMKFIFILLLKLCLFQSRTLILVRRVCTNRLYVSDRVEHNYSRFVEVLKTFVKSHKFYTEEYFFMESL